MHRRLTRGLPVLCALAGLQILCAQSGPGIIPIGSPLTFGGTNTPDTFSANVTFSSTPVIVDNGAVKIWQEQVPTGSNGEWDIFHLQTVNGGSLAGNVNANWSIVMNYTLSAAVYFDQVATQFAFNGTPFSPLQNFSSICCATATNPILPGWAWYNSGFQSALPAGVQMNWQEIFGNPYNIFSQGGVNVNTANQLTFALHFTLQPSPPTVSKVISAGQFGAFATFGPGSWIEIYGSNLAASTQQWGNSDFTGVNAPTALGGTKVTVAGQPAFVEYISPTQVNVQVPLGVPSGSQSLEVTNAAGSSAPFAVNVVADQPGLLATPAFNINGTQYAVALFSDGVTFALPPGAIAGVPSRRPRPGDTITLYGIGFSAVNPNIPPGQITNQINSLVAPLTVALGVNSANVTYDGLAPNYVGLYQFNVVVPSIAASDQVPLTFTLGGAAGTQKLYLPVGP